MTEISQLRIVGDYDAAGYQAGAQKKIAADQAMIASDQRTAASAKQAATDAAAAIEKRAAASAKATAAEQESERAIAVTVRQLERYATSGAGAARIDAQLEQAKRKLAQAERDAATAVGNDVNLRAAAARGVDAQRAKVAQLESALARELQLMNNTATVSQQLRPYMANLTAQFNDVGVSLLSGQKPLTVFIQQGAQIQGIFQQAGVSLRTFVNPLTISIAAVAALGAGFAVVVGRAFELERQLRSMKIALDATAGASGLSAAAVQTQVLGFARTPGVDRDTAASAATNILRNPLINADQFARILPLARDYAAITGTEIPAAAKALADGLTGGYAAALKLDQQFQFLSVSEKNLIRDLEEQGRTADAANVMLQAMERHAKGVADQGVLPLDRAAKDLTNTWNTMLDSMAKGEAFGAAKKYMMELIDVASGKSTGAGPGGGLATLPITLATLLSGALARVMGATPQNDLSAPIGLHSQGQQTIDQAGQVADALQKIADPANLSAGAVHKLAEDMRVLGDTLDPAGRKLKELSNTQDSVTLAFQAGAIQLNDYMTKMGILANMKVQVPTPEKIVADAEAEARESRMAPAARARAQAERNAPPVLTGDLRTRYVTAKGQSAVGGSGFNLAERIGAIDAEVVATKRIVDAYAQSEEAGRRAELVLKAISQQHKLGADAIAKYTVALEREDAAKRQIAAARDLRLLQDEIAGQEQLTAALAQSTVEYDKQKIAIDAAGKARQGYSPQQVAQFEQLATRQLQDRYRQEAIQLNRQLDPVAQFNDTIAKLKELEKTGVASATAIRAAHEEAYIRLGRAGDSWLGGLQAGLLDFARTARNVGEQVSSAMVQALSAGTDALARLMVGLKVDFKSLLLDLRLSLARAFIGANLTGPLAGLLGGGVGALGGLVPGMGGVGGVGGMGGAGGGAGGGLFTGGGLGDLLGGLRFAFGPNGMLGSLFGGGAGSLSGAALGSAGAGAAGAIGGGFNFMGGIGGLLGGAMNFATGNPIGGIAGLIGGALSFIPGLGPIGGIIGALGGILGGLTKKKPKAPQGVSNLAWTDGSWITSVAMNRGKGNLSDGTSKAGGAVGDIIDELTGMYGLGLGPGTPGGFLINSIGKKTGNLWQVGLGTYANPQQLPSGFQNGGSTVTAAYTDPQQAISALAAMIVKAGAAGGSLTGLTGTQQTALRSEKVLDIESIKRALDFSKIYDKLSRGRENITAAEDAIESINDEFRSLRVQAQTYGLDVGIINQRMEEARRKLATDFNDVTRRSLLGINDPDALAREDLTKAQEARRKEADYLNSLFPGLINFADLIALSNAELVELEKTLGHANDNIRDALDRIKFGPDISNLTLKQRYGEALGQYQTLEAQALRGDTTLDKDRLTQVGDLFLQLSRQLYSITAQNAGDISRVQRLYEGILGVGPMPGMASGGSVSAGSFWAGEHGPELVRVRTPATVHSRGDSDGLVQGVGELVNLSRGRGNLDAEMLKELRALRAEFADLKREMAGNRAYHRAKGQAVA